MGKWIHLLSWLLIWPTLFANDPDLRADLVQRRQSVMEKMGNRGMLILFSADVRPYAGDVAYEFRQENNLFYLTGSRHPETTLVLMPQKFLQTGDLCFCPIVILAEKCGMGKWRALKRLRTQAVSKPSGAPLSFDSFLDSVFVRTSLPEPGQPVRRLFRRPSEG